MGSLISANDVLAAAVEIERRGHKFYMDAAAAAKGTPAGEFFAYMAGEEEKHEKIFAGMLSRIGGIELPPCSDGGEYLAYLQASLDTHLLFMNRLPEDADPFVLAVRFEKDTIMYFLAMLDMVPESEKVHVRQCIEEEKKHILLISKKRNEI